MLSIFVFVQKNGLFFKIEHLSVKSINNGSVCSVLYLSTTGLFPARRKILQHLMQSSAITLFF